MMRTTTEIKKGEYRAPIHRFARFQRTGLDPAVVASQELIATDRMKHQPFRSGPVEVRIAYSRDIACHLDQNSCRWL